MDSTLTTLAGQIAQLDSIDSTQLERMRHEALTAPAPWKAEYSAYQSGGWWTTSLMNASGDAADVTIGDCTAKPTDLLAQMPATTALLNELGLNYMWVRLARLEPNAFLWEHRDYDDLDQVERHRLHIPLHTNSSAFLVTGGTKVHMAAWADLAADADLRPRRVQPARPRARAPDRRRVCRRRLPAAGPAPDAPPGRGRALPDADQMVLAERMQAARGMVALGYTEAAERMLLRLFYTYALPEGAVYDLLVELHTSLGDVEAATRWTAAKSRLLALTA